MKHLLIILSFHLLSSPLFGQSERPETIIIPVSSMGDVSDTRKQILQNTLEDELKSHFRLVSQEKYEQVLEQVFEELEYEECSVDSCIVRVQEMLQVENVFNLQIIGEGKDTQINLTWRTLDEKKNEEDFCKGCGTFELREMIGGLVEKLVGEKRVEVVVEKKPEIVVEKKEKGVMYYYKKVGNGELHRWHKDNKNKDINYIYFWKYEGEIEDGVPDGQGKITFGNGDLSIGEYKEGFEWNTSLYDKNGKILSKYVNGKYIGQ